MTAFNDLASLGKGSKVHVTGWLKTTASVRDGVELAPSEAIATSVELQRVKKLAGGDDAGHDA